MKEEHIKNLIEKYNAGITSLEDEKMLIESGVNVDESIQKLSIFIKKNRKKAPENFNETLWESFEEKTNKPNHFKLRLLAIAASIALIVSLFVGNYTQKELTLSEKEALLNEAKSMFVASNQHQTAYNIIVENELIVVYTKSE